MQNFLGNLRYALRQFRLSPIFTTAAILTLALGIGGTTAIFTLIHAVMLRSLPVGDPAGLYRVGDGNDCCVEGGPQDRWGMFSYPLYERLKAESPEFEEAAAFQAGGRLLSVRRAGTESAAKPLESEYVTGNYFQTLGVGAFGGRVLTPEDDKPAAPPVAVISHRAWQTTYGSDPAVVGSTFVIEGHPFTIIGVSPPGFFGETLRDDPPDIWVPIQQEPMIDGNNQLLHQSISAWLRMIGRVRPGASVDGMSARLTGVLRQWMQNDSGYPANWMPDIIRMLPKAVHQRCSCGRGRRHNERTIWPQPSNPSFGLRLGAADRLRQCREPSSRTCGHAPWTNRRSPRSGCHASPNYFASSHRERAARNRRRHRRTSCGRGSRTPASDARFP